MDKQNGPATNLPALVIGYDASAQTVAVKFDPLEFRTWEHVLAVLEMARLWADDQRRLAVMARLQKGQQEAALEQAIRSQIRRA